MSSPYQAPAANLDEGHMHQCKGCGSQIHSSASSCPQCGATRRSRAYKSKGVAAALALLLGGLGVHRFYLGQWWGIFYLLLFWLWIPGLIALVEFIYFLVCDQNKWDAKHNQGIPAAPNEESGAGVIVAIVAGVVVFVAMLGILAAVALPAYQDYTIRGRVAEAMVETIEIRTGVERYYNNNGQLPLSNSDIGMENNLITSANHTINMNSGEVTITFSAGWVSQSDSPTFVFTPFADSNGLSWDCTGGTLEARFRPAKCRGTDY